jgi:hypothetical protein
MEAEDWHIRMLMLETREYGGLTGVNDRLNLFSSCPCSPGQCPQKNHKAGLVGPAFPIVELSAVGLVSIADSECQQEYGDRRD